MPVKQAQKTHIQHAVPQNVLEVEFKIIGDLTMRQFVYIAIFGAMAYASFALLPQLFKWPVAIVSVLGGLGFSFVPIEDRGLDQWIINGIKAVYKENQMIWKKEPEDLIAFSYANLDVIKQEMITLAPTSSRRKLEEFLNEQTDKTVLDPLDIPEAAYIKKVRHAFAQQPTIGVTDSPQQPSSETTIQEEPTQKTHQEAESTKQTSKPQEEKISEKSNETNNEKNTSKNEQKQQKESKPRPIQKQKQKQPALKMPERANKSSNPLSPITPDRLTGRRFTNLLPSQGQIILPVRGERILETTAEEAIEQDIDQKAEQLKQLLVQIRQSENVQAPQVVKKAQTQVENITQQNQQPQAKEVSNLSEDRLKSLQAQNKELSDQIERLRKEVEASKNKTNEAAKEKLDQLQKEKAANFKQYVSLRDTLSSIRPPKISLGKDMGMRRDKKIEEIEKQEQPKKQPQQKIAKQKKEIKSQYNQASKLIKADGKEVVEGEAPVFTGEAIQAKKPNIISGIVKDPGGKSLDAVVLIIKNSKGEPVRALKTDKTGQFIISTPVANGIYTIETDKAKKTAFTFDIIKIEAVGGFIPPIEIRGKFKDNST